MKLGFVIVYVADVTETLQFYQKAFDLEINLEHKENDVVLYGEMATEGAVLGFASHEMGQLNLAGQYQKISPDNEPVGQEIVFVHKDVDAVYRKAINAGATSIAEPTEKPWGQTVAYIRTIEGTLIEICSPMDV